VPPPAVTPAQQPAPQPAPTLAEPGPAPLKRFYIGLRGRQFPIPSGSIMANGTSMTTTITPTPARDWHWVTTSHSPRWSGGLSLELGLTQKWAVVGEVLFSRLKYTKVTTASWGADDPTTSDDERSHLFQTEDTRASLWDVPVLARYRGLADTGPLSRFYFNIGATVRNIMGIHSSIRTTFPDTTESISTEIVPPAKRNVIGGVFGLGIRIIDDYRIHWTPEFRYTRWLGSTYASQSTVSPRNQIEIGIGLTF
jgi:hypothetical protein